MPYVNKAGTQMQIDWFLWIGSSIAITLMLLGLVGTILPFLPGVLLIFLGALLLGWATHFSQITLYVLLALGLLAIFAQTMDYLASSIGAKKFGSSRWGIAGAIVGSIFGLFIGGPFEFALFPFLFAFLFELLAAGKTAKHSLRTAFGSLIGILGGIIMQFMFGLIMIGTVLIAILW